MTSSPSDPAPMDDPQTHPYTEPDEVPSSEETVADDAGVGSDEDVRPDLDEADVETDMPGADPDWPQESVEGNEP